jgi:hypothetical protein
VTDETTIEITEANPTVTISENVGSITTSSTSLTVSINGDSNVVVTETVETQAVTITQNQTVSTETESVSIVTVGTQGPQGIKGDQGEPTDISNLVPYDDATDNMDLGDFASIAATHINTNNFILNYVNGALDNITYANGIEKDFTYNGDGTLDEMIVTMPDTSTITKTFSYSAGNLVGVTVT